MPELAGMVNRVFTLTEFQKYLVDEVAPMMKAWRPSMIVDHNTGTNPHWTKDSTADQSLQLVKNMSVTWASPPNDWHSGPHLVIGPNCLIVAAWPLWMHGTHSPSWNEVSWGIEHSADFDKELMADDFRATSLGVKKALFKMLGLLASDATYKHHHEDPHTSHKHCPGVNFGTKASWLTALNTLTPFQKTLDLPHRAILAFSDGMKAKLKSMEAFREQAYNLKGIWHVGWGFRDGYRGLHVDATTTMTLEAANKFFDESTSAEAGTIQTLVTVPLKQYQLDALGIFAWNTGTGALAGSTILKDLNAGDIAGAAAGFDLWNKWRETPDGPLVVSPELTVRRAYERSVFEGKVDLAPSPPVGTAPPAPRAVATAKIPPIMAQSMPATAKPSVIASKQAAPVGNRQTSLLGASQMSVLPSTSTLNIGSILAMAAGLGALLPKIATEYSTVGIVAAAALGVGLLIQAFIPPATAATIENTVADELIPVAEQFLPSDRALLDQIRGGLKTAASGVTTAANATAAIAASATPTAS